MDLKTVYRLIGIRSQAQYGSLASKEQARIEAHEHFDELLQFAKEILDEKPERKKITQADSYPAGMSECERVGMAGNCPGTCDEEQQEITQLRTENKKLKGLCLEAADGIRNLKALIKRLVDGLEKHCVLCCRIRQQLGPDDCTCNLTDLIAQAEETLK